MFIFVLQQTNAANDVVRNTAKVLEVYVQFIIISLISLVYSML